MSFKSWFEQDENGIIAYHGSPNKIGQFSTEFLGKGHDQEGPGIYFTTDPSDAAYYGGSIHKVLLQPRKLIPLSGRINQKQIEALILAGSGLTSPKDLRNMDMDQFYESPLSDFDENPVRAFFAAVESVMKYSKSPHDAFQNVWITHFRYSPQKYLQEMVKLGYDGVRVPKTGLDHYIIFNPAVIKNIS